MTDSYQTEPTSILQNFGFLSPDSWWQSVSIISRLQTIISNDGVRCTKTCVSSPAKRTALTLINRTCNDLKITMQPPAKWRCSCGPCQPCFILSALCLSKKFHVAALNSNTSDSLSLSIKHFQLSAVRNVWLFLMTICILFVTVALHQYSSL